MRIKKNSVFILLALLFTTNLTGCRAVMDKFTRKKDDQAPDMYLDLKYYQEVGGENFYKKFYMFAKGWLEEVQDELESGSNLKRIKVRLADAQGYIERMETYVNAEGRSLIAPVVKDLEVIAQKVNEPYLIGSSKQLRLAEQLEDTIRKFVKTCSIKKMKQHIIEQ